jgi:hypothetical protein
MSGPIATYLDELDRVLAFDPRLSRRVHDEIESHLFDTAEQVGEADAVRRFGRPAEIARAYAEAALPDRLRRSCLAAALLGGTTLLLMRLRTVLLDIPGGGDPLTSLDRGGLVAALLCIGAAWWLSSRHRIATVRTALHPAAGCLALSVGASLLRAVEGGSGDGAFALIVGTAVVELVLVGGLMAQLARLDRYARRLAA